MKLIFRETVETKGSEPKVNEIDCSHLGMERLLKRIQKRLPISGRALYDIFKTGRCEMKATQGTIRYEILEVQDAPSSEGSI